MNDEIRSFDEYFQLYLQERQNPWTRRVQLLGTSVALSCVAGTLLTGQRSLLLGAAAAAFGPAWLSHRFIEKNRPRTNRYLGWKLRADLLLWSQTLQAALSGEAQEGTRPALAEAAAEQLTRPKSPGRNGKESGYAHKNGHAARAAGNAAEPIRFRPTASRGWAVWE